MLFLRDCNIKIRHSGLRQTCLQTLQRALGAGGGRFAGAGELGRLWGQEGGHCYYYIGGLEQSIVAVRTLQRPFIMDYRERGSYARGVYPTQDTSRMGAARMKQEEGHNYRAPRVPLP